MLTIRFVLSALAIVAPFAAQAQQPKAFLAAKPTAPQPQAPKTDLPAVLKKLDASSATFKSAEATFTQDSYNKLAGDHTMTNGRRYLMHTREGLQIGIRTEGPQGKTVEYKDGIIRAQNKACYDTVTGANKGKFDSFLTLGFGGSGEDLAAAWDITDDGPEIIGGIKTEKLELIPKDAGVRRNYAKVVLWMDVDRDVSIKQVLFNSAGDSDTALYTGIKVNSSKIDTKPFTITGKPCTAK